MLTLANYQLRIEMLDPVADRARLGSRFCWGGFIWQIHDLQAGPLLAGPEWPAPNPSAWNAQGLPESFRHRTRDGHPLTWNRERGVALGAGELATNAAGEVEVITPCVWKITPRADRVDFHTRQQAAGFDYELERRIELNNRVVRSHSTLKNHGSGPLTLQWFAHPFFALTDRLIQAVLPTGTTLAENPGFTLRSNELTQQRRFEHLKDGHLDFLQLPAGTNLSARLSHPVLTHVGFDCSFAPEECMIWGNNNTFSIEPYRVLSLAPNQSMEWSLRYDFGAARA